MIKNYSTKQINANWLIKVYGVDENGNRVNKLVGVSGLLKLIGLDLAAKFIARAFRDALDKCVCKLRRGLKITFYAH
jgi:hypothetical protein